jgi:hypothetical protein
MRISTWLRLLALCLTVVSLPASPAVAQQQAREPKKAAFKKEFEGCGINESAARKDALDLACAWLKENSGLDWSPDSEYLVDHNMAHFGEAEDRELEVAKDITKDGKLKYVKMQLEITDAQARDIGKQAQQYRMQERQKYSLLALLGGMGLLGVVGGYLRLEEATKGYYTRLLRLAAIGILVVIVAGLCVAG